MPDALSNWLDDGRSAASASVDRLISQIQSGRRLPAQTVQGYRGRDFQLGWRVNVLFSDGVHRELHVLTDSDFPYVAPRVALANAPDVGTWPHLEGDGLLCLVPPDAAVSCERPGSVVEYLLGEACKLVEDCVSGRNREDLRDEFLSYWSHFTDSEGTRFISLVEPRGPARRIVVWRGKEVTVVGEDSARLNTWLRHRGVLAAEREYTFDSGVLLWLPEVLLPTEYPRTATDLRTLAVNRAPLALQVMEEFAAANADETAVLLGARSSRGSCFGAVTVHGKKQSSRPRWKRRPLEAGFRPGRVPRSLMLSRYLWRNSAISRSVVERADHEWIHGRDHDGRQQVLRDRRVAVLGCGSVGSTVARLLAQAVSETFCWSILTPWTGPMSAAMSWERDGCVAIRPTPWPRSSEILSLTTAKYDHPANDSGLQQRH